MKDTTKEEQSFAEAVKENSVLATLIAFGFVSALRKKVVEKWFPQSGELLGKALVKLNQLGQSSLTEGKLLSARSWERKDGDVNGSEAKTLEVRQGSALARIMSLAIRETVTATVKDISAGRGAKRIFRPQMRGEGRSKKVAEVAPDYKLALCVLRRAGFTVVREDLKRENVEKLLAKYVADSAKGAKAKPKKAAKVEKRQVKRNSPVAKASDPDTIKFAIGTADDALATEKVA